MLLLGVEVGDEQVEQIEVLVDVSHQPVGHAVQVELLVLSEGLAYLKNANKVIRKRYSD